ncbi:MAG: hypothetical protein J7647_19390 [Cyanobacteria bacterium SBLK]|nr:hypothetical protein [Cyanobacteria bacterium SBLK]
MVLVGFSLDVFIIPRFLGGQRDEVWFPRVNFIAKNCDRIGQSQVSSYNL